LRKSLLRIGQEAVHATTEASRVHLPGAHTHPGDRDSHDHRERDQRHDRADPIALGLMALAAGTSGVGCSPSRRPNVVLINVDDLGWTDLGCYGSTYYDTPNIDKLCAEGVKFTDAYAAAAVCSPTRSALMTGRSPARTGVTDWLRHPAVKEESIPAPDGHTGRYVEDPDRPMLCPTRAERLPPGEQTLAEVLQRAGYATAHVGKWHLGHGESAPEHQGFDLNRGGGWQGQTPSYWDPYQDEANRGLASLPSRRPGEYLTDREAAEAVAFIGANASRPFFLNLWHYAVHTPLHAKDELIQKYEAREGATRKAQPIYGAMLESVDQAVGAVVHALDELGIAEQTCVILTSDNGGQKKLTPLEPLRGGKGEPYEGGIRVPQIVRFRGRVAPGVSSFPTTSVDVLPTLCAFAGAPLPAGVVIDGRSLVGPLAGNEPEGPVSSYWHYPHYWNDFVPYSIVRRGPWKLIHFYEPNDRFELYDLANDLEEAHDLANEKPLVRDALRADLTAWLDDVGALLPRPRSEDPTKPAESGRG
jgi:arylsulfatase A